MADILAEKHIRYVLMNGGNGTMAPAASGGGVPGQGISVMGIPRPWTTTSLSPTTARLRQRGPLHGGHGAELGVDVRSLPHPRGGAGLWAATRAGPRRRRLAREQEGDAPHLLYPPERPFHEDEFLDRVGDMYRKLGGVVVVASEGSPRRRGQAPSCPHLPDRALHVLRRCVLHLAQLVVRRLGIKARSEKPGILAWPPSPGSPRWMPPKQRRRAARPAGRCWPGRRGRWWPSAACPPRPTAARPSWCPSREVMLGERVLPAEHTSPPAAPT